jgi:hypothetical protein
VAAAPLWAGATQEVCDELGIELSDLSGPQQAMVDSKIASATAKVADYLNRPGLAPAIEEVADLVPVQGRSVYDYRAFPQVERRFDDRYVVGSVQAALSGAEGAYDVTFKVGIDVPNTEAVEFDGIRRFIVLDAAHALRMDTLFKAVERSIVSVSAGGQSVTYERPGQSGAAGGLPTMDTLRRWRRYSVYSRTSHPIVPFPY